MDDYRLAIYAALALALVLGALLWQAVAARRTAGRLEQQLAEQHRAMLNDLHGGLAQQSDRLGRQGGETAERLRQAVVSELRDSREAMQRLHLALQSALGSQREETASRLQSLTTGLQERQDRLRKDILEQTLTTLGEHARADRELLQSGITQSSVQISSSIEALTRTVNERLEAIGGQVRERLDSGFARTNETFANVMARLATIDEAQKKIDGLTTNVIGLQELLGDKKARGAFGEVQLEALVRNALPPGGFEFQYTLPNGTRADCVLKLPEPTGMVAVDAKFPLENYHRMFDPSAGEAERKAAQAAFRADVKRHVDAIGGKYIIQNVTSDGAVMFVPAEAVFAEIHAYHAEVVAYAQAKRVWIVSPTTLMAVLNTARAVLKDVETRRQIHLIKDALGKLAKDFTRFDERMANLARHIEQASKDAQDVQTSSRKISGQFIRIEQAQFVEPAGAEQGRALPAA
jgi:DNA recombination protein RmuC